MILDNSDRVRAMTSARINERIDADIAGRVRTLAGHPTAIDARLNGLTREWDLDRALELTAGTFVLLGSLLGATVHRRLFALPAIVGGWLAVHALVGWCPPAFAFRKLRIRTRQEIDRERWALRILRGDFAPEGISRADEAMSAVT